MIIRITFNDNDFQHILKGPLKDYGLRGLLQLQVINKYEEDQDIQKRIENEDRVKLYLTKLTNGKKFTQQEKDGFKQLIKEAYITYINKSIQEDDTKTYLIENLEIELTDSITDKWENGEVLYYFSSADAYHIS